MASIIAQERHPRYKKGPAVAVYIWQLPIRIFHWGLALSLVILAPTGYYIHNPFLAVQGAHPFVMGWFRFVHEVFGMVLIALFILRMYLFFAGDRWVRWRAMVPIRGSQYREMVEVTKFYAMLRPNPVLKVGHNAMAAASYIGLYSMLAVEIVTGLVLFNWLLPSPLLTPLVGWMPRVVSLQNLRLIHYGLTYAIIAYVFVHLHLSLLSSRAEKNGLMDSIFSGYKVIPTEEIAEDDREAIEDRL